MSRSPFMTPSRNSTFRELAARRRRRRGLLGLLALAALAAGAILLIADRIGTGHSPRHGAARTITPAGRPHPPGLSPAGFPLVKPALALAGLAKPARDPVQLLFHHPPRSGLLVNLATGQVLWQRNALRQLRIASLTKMMTALVTVKSSPPSDEVLITKSAIEEGGSKVGLLPLHRHVRLETLLYGLLLPSGNDAAVALAEHVAGSTPAFVRRMNEEAARLGLGCTRFSTPSGFIDQGNFSCAADLAVLAAADLQQPRIARVTRSYQAVLPFPIKGGKLYLYNNNPMLIYRYPGTTGLKTGWTIAAGRCLVATAERDGVKLGAVVLDSEEPGIQAKKLLDHGFRDVYHLPSVPEEQFPPGA